MPNNKTNKKPGGLIEEGGNSQENKTGNWSARVACVDPKKCIKCHQCVIFCPEGCIEIMSNGKDVKVNADYCKGCSVCAVECPVQAISMEKK